MACTYTCADQWVGVGKCAWSAALLPCNNSTDKPIFFVDVKLLGGDRSTFSL